MDFKPFPNEVLLMILEQCSLESLSAIISASLRCLAVFKEYRNRLVQRFHHNVHIPPSIADIVLDVARLRHAPNLGTHLRRASSHRIIKTSAEISLFERKLTITPLTSAEKISIRKPP